MSRKISDDEKRKRGTFRKDRKKPEVRLPEMEQLPEPRDFLTRRGAVIYYEAAHHLNNNGLLNDPIASQVNAYAHELDLYFTCVEKIAEQGECKEVKNKQGEFMYYQTNPLVKMASAHLSAALAWAKTLLILPVDADKIPPKPEPKEVNPFENL